MFTIPHQLSINLHYKGMNMQLDIITYPNSILRKISEPIENIDSEITELLADMVDTMYASNGIGLAAPQVGISKRIIVLDVAQGDADAPGLIKMINPIITEKNGDTTYEEGCLSVPDMTIEVTRAKDITLEYQDEHGNERCMDATGLFAIAIQHEIDHLDGHVILDYASQIKQDMYLKKRKKIAKQGD